MSIRVALQQRVIPAYRAPFLELLAKNSDIKLAVFAGYAQPHEMITSVKELVGMDYYRARNIHFLSGKYYFCYQPGFLPWVKGWNPDVLIAEANPRYLSTPATVRWMNAQKKPVIGWGLGIPESGGLFSSIRNASRTHFLSGFSSMIAYSETGAQQYIRAGFATNDVFIAKNATSPAPLHPPPEKEITLENYELILLYVGRLQPRKRIGALIKVCSRLPEQLQPRLWIVGDGPIRSDLEELAKNIYPKTQFFGEKYGEELDKIFTQADVFILPGTGGLAIQQAMAHALPVIVAEGDGTQFDLVDETNGWNIAPGNDEELLRVIQIALSDPGDLRIKGLAAYHTVKNNVNIEKMVSVFLQACKHAIKKVGRYE